MVAERFAGGAELRVNPGDLPHLQVLLQTMEIASATPWVAKQDLKNNISHPWSMAGEVLPAKCLMKSQLPVLPLLNHANFPKVFGMEQSHQSVILTPISVNRSEPRNTQQGKITVSSRQWREEGEGKEDRGSQRGAEHGLSPQEHFMDPTEHFLELIGCFTEATGHFTHRQAVNPTQSPESSLAIPAALPAAGFW